MTFKTGKLLQSIRRIEYDKLEYLIGSDFNINQLKHNVNTSSLKLITILMKSMQKVVKTVQTNQPALLKLVQHCYTICMTTLPINLIFDCFHLNFYQNFIQLF